MEVYVDFSSSWSPPPPKHHNWPQTNRRECMYYVSDDYRPQIVLLSLCLGGHLCKKLVRKGGFFSRNLLFKLDNVSEKRLLFNAKRGGNDFFPLNQFLYFFISLLVFILLKVHQLVIFSLLWFFFFLPKFRKNCLFWQNNGRSSHWYWAFRVDSLL
jgi:hypothetical protein